MRAETAGATAITLLLAPGPIALIVLVLGFAWGAYAFRIANYGAASACITGYVVFLVALAGIPQVTAASDRIVYTAIAGALALGASAAWPTWTATGARPAIAAMLEAQSAYVGPLLAGLGLPSVIVQEGGYAVDHLGPLLERFLTGWGEA